MTGPPPDRGRPRLTVLRGGTRRFADQARPGPGPGVAAGGTRPHVDQPRPPPPAGNNMGALRGRSLVPGARPDPSGNPARTAPGDRIVVGVNALETGSATGVLITYGLGSCIAVILFDPGSGVGAMCHYMLPDSAQDPRRAAKEPLMFGDLAIAQLVTAFARRGASPRNVEAYVVGGASLSGMGDLFDIGGRNARMARATLDQLRLPVRGHETGGRASRTVSIDLKAGVVAIATPGLAPRRLR